MSHNMLEKSLKSPYSVDILVILEQQQLQLSS